MRFLLGIVGFRCAGPSTLSSIRDVFVEGLASFPRTRDDKGLYRVRRLLGAEVRKTGVPYQLLHVP